MKYSINHTTNDDGSRLFVLSPANGSFKAGSVRLHRIAPDAPEKYLKAVWGDYSSEGDAFKACRPFLAEEKPEGIPVVCIPAYRTRPSSTGIGWVALQVWNDAEGAYVHAGSYRSEEEALKNAPSSK